MAQAIANDKVLQKSMRSIKHYWSANSFPAPYGNFTDELSVIDGLLFKGSKIAVPEVLQRDMLKKTQEGHWEWKSAKDCQNM